MIKKLTTRIDAVCPIHGLQATDVDPRLWTIDFKDEATEAERDAAVTLLANIDLGAVQTEIDAEQIEDTRLQKIVAVQRQILDAVLEYFDAVDKADKPITPKLKIVLDKWRSIQ